MIKLDKNTTYNDLAFLSFGEAQALKIEIDKLVDIIFEQGMELAELKGESGPHEGT